MLTRGALRRVAAKTIRGNRKVLGGVLKGPDLHNALYTTAGLKVNLVKADMMRGLRKLHPMYSKGLSAKRMGFGK